MGGRFEVVGVKLLGADASAAARRKAAGLLARVRTGDPERMSLATPRAPCLWIGAMSPLATVSLAVSPNCVNSGAMR